MANSGPRKRLASSAEDRRRVKRAKGLQQMKPTGVGKCLVPIEIFDLPHVGFLRVSRTSHELNAQTTRHLVPRTNELGQNGHFDKLPAELVDSIMMKVAQTDIPSASRAMKSCTKLYLSCARHFFKNIFLDFGDNRLDFTKRADTLAGLRRKLQQWSNSLRIRVPDSPTAQASCYIFLAGLNAMTIQRLSFTVDSCLSAECYARLNTEFRWNAEKAARLRESLAIVRLPILTSDAAIKYGVKRNGRTSLLQACITFAFTSTKAPNRVMQMTALGNVTSGTMKANGTPKKIAKAFIQRYTNSSDWIGKMQIFGQKMESDSPDMLSNPLEDLALANPNGPLNNVTHVGFRDVDFRRLSWRTTQSIDWSKVTELVLLECTNLPILFRYIMVSPGEIGIQALKIEERYLAEQLRPANPTNICNFFASWSGLRVVSLTTSLKWCPDLDMLRNHSKLTVCSYALGNQNVSIDWLSQLIEHNPQIGFLGFCCDEVLNALKFDYPWQEFEDKMSQVAEKLVRLRQLRILKVMLHSLPDVLVHPDLTNLGHLDCWNALARCMYEILLKAS